MAEELELDLVEISPNASPPVCKIIDYQKFLYQQKTQAERTKGQNSQDCGEGNPVRTVYR